MRWIKFLVILSVIGVGVYVVTGLLTTRPKTYTFSQSVPYSVDKVFQQFRDVREFASWNGYFTALGNDKDWSAAYFEPYTGMGANAKFYNEKNGMFREVLLKYENLNRSVRYHFLENGWERPVVVDVIMRPKGSAHTNLEWHITIPEQSVFSTMTSEWEEDSMKPLITRSTQRLSITLGNKVDKDLLLQNIIYDSIFTQTRKGALLVGVSATSANRPETLMESTVVQHNKVWAYATMDLAKREDELGFPTMLYTVGGKGETHLSYYYGVEVSKREGLKDQSFSYRTVPSSSVYSMFHRGNARSIEGAVEKLVKKAKADSVRIGDLQQEFLDPPVNGQTLRVKLSLPYVK
ncbi:SRPBCC family protein [Planobacterium oryzisoli]|uniref:Polyketide cyclase n=1 Tax=Planobacterium oryzisoli TaxID=2771435 RepID=A0A930YW75_9FLAO|nr:hypothetical protein [Planobacterium oryzisoli]MBF5027431.1 hypothetical protein [Planobacterium oryzisoli]